MTKILKSKYKISRRLGVSLWGGAKDPFLSKNYPPGQHGASVQRRKTDHGTQLHAKQKLKGYYGYITEKQFFRTFQEAHRMRGNASENLIGLLEKRLDAVVYRLNLAPTIFAARQIVNHKHILVNGKTVNIPSYSVKDNDVIELKEKSRTMPIAMEATQKMERTIPSYLSFEPKDMKGTFLRIPNLADVPYPCIMEPHLIIEFYSK
ncbi:MAG: 30S ribosomal protein S4 [Alphaproteobacteria bacterium]